MPPLLAYDVGMHVGTDTAYLLHRGYSVVAIEANPALAQAGRERFAEEIESGRLTIVEAGIADRDGEATFFVSEVSDWSSFHERIASRAAYAEVEVQTRTFGSILKSHGMPSLMKIDIEGNDGLCLDALSPGFRPERLVVELSSADLVDRLETIGFSRFKLIDQRRGFAPASPRLYRLLQAAPQRVGRRIEGAYVRLRGRRRAHGWTFEFGSSGPIDDPPGRWLSADAARKLIARVRPGTLDDWFDIHAR